MSQSPQAGQFNSYSMVFESSYFLSQKLSQSPQAGQFNSYPKRISLLYERDSYCLNPLKRVNSILTPEDIPFLSRAFKSQSPQAGQFNSYEMKDEMIAKGWKIVSIPSSGSIQFLPKYIIRALPQAPISLNPLKRVNSILTEYVVIERPLTGL